MASNFQIQKPYVLATLPRPLDPTTGRYVVGEVHGTTEGSRKRKRSELSVGIDGEAVNIYNVSSARLVTSYPIPPHSSFTCPPCSLRRRIPGSKDIARYTYLATQDSSMTVSLFKDVVELSGKTTSSTKTLSLVTSSPVVFLTAKLALSPPPNATLVPPSDELWIVREDGEILSVDSEQLQQRWKTSPSILHQDLAAGPMTDFRIEFCTSARLSEVIEGIFKGARDALSSIANNTHHGADVELLVAISSMSNGDHRTRYLHLLGPVSHAQTFAQSSSGLVQLHVIPIGTIPYATASKPLYRLDARGGSLCELSNDTLTVYDLTTSVPRALYQLELEDATSFIRLSKTSILTSTESHLNVYNPQYRSLQSSTALESEPQAEDSTTTSSGCSLVAFFSRLDLAIGISDSNLLAIQLEAPESRAKKRRAEGLLIDSIGRGIPGSKRIATVPKNQAFGTSTFTHYLPGSMLGDYWETWSQDVERADALLEADDIDEFEAVLAKKFGLEIRNTGMTNGVSRTNGDHPQTGPEWVLPQDRSRYPRVDRQWLIYSISKAFHWSHDQMEGASTPRLTCTLPYTNVVSYLVDAGHLTISNMKSALRHQLAGLDNIDSVLTDELITLLADLDPTMELLTCYITATPLGSVELLVAVRIIMRSLELVQDPSQPPPKLLSNGVTEEAENGDIGMELDNLEEEVRKAESILNGNTGIRGSGLSVAFTKLANCPAQSLIRALRRTLKPEEILSLVYLLRVELVKGAWTSRYLDNTDFEEDAELDAPPDGIIKLIADLLSRCVDSIGPGGWLLNDAILAGDDTGDFIAALKLEVSAALEGLEEATYLKGVVGEAVRYCEAAQKAESRQKLDLAKPIALQVKEPGAEALPLGLKVKEKIEATKVVSGGEIMQRSTRERGHLRSQQVGPYSLERIAI